MNFGDITKFAEAHPTETIIIGAGGLVGILWLLGYIGGGSSAQASNAGTQNLAAAYYAAEAQQAVVGGQIQMANIAANMNTAIAGIQANAAQGIVNTQANAATTINSQNTGTAQTINAQNISLGQQQVSAALQATLNSNNNTLAAIQSSNATAGAVGIAQAQAGAALPLMGNTLPIEFAGGQPISGFV